MFDKSDYINANYVRGKDFGVPYDYISTQGPIEDTIYDFWRMIWQEKCPLIVMVAKEVERGRVRNLKFLRIFYRENVMCTGQRKPH